MSEEPDADEATALAVRLRELEGELLEALSAGADAADPVALDHSRVGRVSRGDALQQQAMAQAGQRVLRQRLAAVRAALARVASGDYGRCTECDDPIAPARLQRQPEAERCVRCQSASEGASGR